MQHGTGWLCHGASHSSGRIATEPEHSHQALLRTSERHTQLFKADRGIDIVAHRRTAGVGVATQQSLHRFLEQPPRKARVARARTVHRKCMVDAIVTIAADFRGVGGIGSADGFDVLGIHVEYWMLVLLVLVVGATIVGKLSGQLEISVAQRSDQVSFRRRSLGPMHCNALLSQGVSAILLVLLPARVCKRGSF
jgi:hypothetical protein